MAKNNKQDGGRAVLDKFMKKAEKLLVDKKTTKTKKGNDIKDLVSSDVVAEVIGKMAGGSKDEKQDKFLLYYMLGYTGREAGVAAGYSDSYATCGILQTLRKSGKLRERLTEISNCIPEKYKAWVRLRLSKVAQIDDAVLDKMLDDPTLALKHPQVLRQLKTTGGVLEDLVVVVPTMNIKSLKVMQNINLVGCEARLEFLEGDPDDRSTEAFNAWVKKKERAGPEVIDAEVEEVSQEEDAE